MNIYMRKTITNKKNIVCWGAGDIYKKCILNYPDFNPIFVVDKDPDKKIDGMIVVQPSQIMNFSEIFIVITTIKQESIIKYLNGLGLKEYEDYIGFEKYFGKSKTVSESLEELRKKRIDQSDVTLIVGPFLLSRESKMVCNFINSYAKSNRDRRHILLECSEGLFDEENNLMEFECFEVAKVCLYNGCREDDFVDYIETVCDMSDAERVWVESLENNKLHTNQTIATEIAYTIFQYFKCVLGIIRPQRVLIWGAWNRNYYIIKKLCNEAQIQFRCMEFGWIKNTMQVGCDTDILYQYYNHGYPVFKKNEGCKKCLEHVMDLYSDTNISYKMLENEGKSIKQLPKGNPNILVVGVSDLSIGFLRESDYQKRYISNIVDSSLDLLDIMTEICTRNKWNLIFKPHPIDRFEVQYDIYRDNKQVCFIDDIAIEKLIDVSDVVVSIFSKSDYLTLAHNKPLVMVGNYSLSKSGATYSPTCKDDIESCIKKAIRYGVTEEQRVSFSINVQQILTKYAWKLSVNSRGLDFNTDFFENN